MSGPENQPKTLIFRLSSMGDIVLSTAALSALATLRRRADWVSASEYGQLLEGHPVIDQLILFDRRSTGMLEWIKLCAALASSGEYEEVLDLHRNIRTRLARLIFYVSGSGARWTSIDKQRLRNLGYFTFKKLWPVAWRPEPVVDLFSRVVEESAEAKKPLRGRPDLKHMTQDGFSVRTSLGAEFENGYVCVMPSAQWFGKRWPVDSYVRALVERSTAGAIELPIVVMGGKSDVASIELVEKLRNAGRLVCSGVGRWNLRDAAKVLAHSRLYLGSDTGLAHLTEAVGKPSVIIYGPTSPHAGFGPWGAESASVANDLWCSPCGKIGRICFRPVGRFECQKRLPPEQVREAALDVIRGSQ
jgi:heptosyltransferase-1